MLVETTLHPQIETAERVGDEIAVLAAHIEVATARLLELVREFDSLGGWGNGFASCAHWLNWRVGISLHAAREQVRTARALAHLPLIAQAFARAALSYSKVRALTRVATPETEERLLTFATHGTAAHVEQIVSAWRQVDRAAETRLTVQRQKSSAWSSGRRSTPPVIACMRTPGSTTRKAIRPAWPSSRPMRSA